MSIYKKENKGFTLIELLVVVAIISLLSSIVLASLNSARGKARDAKRISDMHQISIALELYYSDNGKYPDILPVEWTNNLDGTTNDYNKMMAILVAGKYIGSVPKDPSPSAIHFYSYSSWCGTPGAAGSNPYRLMTATEFAQPINVFGTNYVGSTNCASPL